MWLCLTLHMFIEKMSDIQKQAASSLSKRGLFTWYVPDKLS